MATSSTHNVSGNLHVGPSFKDKIHGMLTVNGDAYIHNNLLVKDNIDTNTLTANTIIVNNISQKSIYTNKSLTIVPHDGVSIIYANPINNTIDIYLKGINFEHNRELIIKDVTLSAGPGSSYDINIHATSGTKIETYNTTISTALIPVNGGSYKLNTSGGSVTLRFAILDIALDTLPVWLIQSQFNGNPRLNTFHFKPN